jgi:uncharacterized protein YbaP (TraB family)
MDEPKELNWWIKATQNVRAIIKPHIETYNLTHPKKLSGTIHVSVAKLLKLSEKLSATLIPKEDDIIEVFKQLLPEELLESPLEELLEVPLEELLDVPLEAHVEEHVEAHVEEHVEEQVEANVEANVEAPLEAHVDHLEYINKVEKLNKLLTDFFNGETTEIIIRRKRRGCC